ncbi:MAG: signal recognition particle receptor subunit alpha [Candidatus Micrarchaeota archaeon]
MGLGENLRKAMEKIRNSGSLDKDTVKEVVKEIQRALISSDVQIELVLKLTKQIEEEAFKDLPKGINRREFITKNTYDILAEALGGSKKLEKVPERILMVGLYGSGKSTSCAKIAKYYAKRGKKVGLICADVFRPAAFEQLKQLSEKIEVPFFGIQEEKNAAKVVREGIKEFKGFDLIIVDSAGRSALDQELVKEIKEVNSALKPDLTLLVLGADIGQIAGKQAKAFHESVRVNGVIITKMDGSAKGGGTLIACSITNAPVYFIGTGEKMGDLEEFDATRYLSRIMGYGDLQGLLEKVKEATEDEEVDLEELMKKEFNLDVFYKQLKAARKMGPLNKVIDMMGMGQQIPKEQMELGEEKLDAFKVIMDSMTQKEKLEPELLNHSRILRIAKGAGKKEEDVRELIKHYKQMKKVFKQMKKLSDPKMLEKKGALDKLMKKFGKKKKVKFR